MPSKYRIKNRNKFKKSRYKVTNWSEYNKALRNCGDLSFYLTDDLLAQWYEERVNYSGRGRPRCYSEQAVSMCLLVRQLFHLPLRHTQGVMRWLFKVMASRKTPSIGQTHLAQTISLCG